MRLRRFTLPLLLALSLSTPMQADLVISGRAAQALHCAAMLFMVSELLAEAQMIEPRTAMNARIGAILMLQQVPGSKAEKTQAMRQRFQRIAASRSPPYLLREYASTTKWCNAHFLPKG